MIVSVISGLLIALVSVHAQAPGPVNTDPGCNVYGSVGDDPYYYSSGDTDDFGIVAYSGTSCSPGSYAQVSLATPGGASIDCGYLALNGASQLISCPDYPRGSGAVGGYTFYFFLGANQAYYSFSITHTQVTSTAPTPTNIFTTTPTDTVTSTVTTTQTDTQTTQVTVTTPASTNVMTITTSLARKTVTTTKTITFVRTLKKYAVTKTTTTSTAPCSSPTIIQCATKAGKSKRMFRPGRAEMPRGLQKRDTPNGGEGVFGDGPRTTTVTPDAETTTSTADATTTTVTTTTNAPDTTTTIAGTPATIIISTGTASSTTTITLPQRTKTRTVYAATLVTKTVTQTYTFTKKTTTTPICKS